jgi:CRP-like cAMP-binding protein
MSVKNYQDNDEIVEQGEHPQKVIFVVEGRVIVRKKTSDDTFANVAITPPGRTLCEQSFFDGEPASAFCIARGEVIILEMSRKQYEKLSEEHPKIALILNEYLASIISQRLRNLLGKLSEMSEYFGIR